MKTCKKHIKTLREFYKITGDGVATLIVRKIKKDNKFQQLLEKLSKLDIRRIKD